jgi:hypothetical protein
MADEPIKQPGNKQPGKGNSVRAGTLHPLSDGNVLIVDSRTKEPVFACSKRDIEILIIEREDDGGGYLVGPEGIIWAVSRSLRDDIVSGRIAWRAPPSEV